MKINIIVAFSKNMGIGLNNALPWNIPSDLKKFKNLTTGNNNNAVIMGKNTWESLPVKYLNNRDNLILSKTLNINVDYNINNTNIDNNITKKICKIRSFSNVNSIMEFCKLQKYDDLWIIGGSQIYDLFINNENIIIDSIYITYIDKEYECNCYFPEINLNKYSKNIQLHVDNKNLHDFKIYDIVYNIIENKT